MKIVLRVVGKMRDKRMGAICTEYLDRARRHLTIEEQEVNEDAGLIPLGQNPPGQHAVALDPKGQAMDTAALAGFIEKHMIHGTRTLLFVIGGAEGLAPDTKKRADTMLSLSNLTLPHRLAKVLLSEQIYRCLSDIRGEPYNK